MNESITTTIRIPTPLRPYTGNESSVKLHGETVGEAVAELAARYPSLRDQLYDGFELRSFVNLFLNGEDIRSLEGTRTALSTGDKLAIIPAIAGG